MQEESKSPEPKKMPTGTDAVNRLLVIPSEVEGSRCANFKVTSTESSAFSLGMMSKLRLEPELQSISRVAAFPP